MQEKTMLKRLELTDKVSDKDERTLKEVIENDITEGKKIVMQKIKEGYDPSDDVLNSVRIRRTVGESTIKQIITDKITKKDKKVYPKETMKLDKILKEIRTLEHENTDE